MRKKTTSIGGQAVIEGVMMRGTKSVATAVRNEKGDIVVESSYVKPVREKNILFRIPVIRGFLNFISSMVIGMKNLMRSGEVFGEDAEPGKFEKWLSKKFGVDVYSIVMAISVVLGIALSVFLFVSFVTFMRMEPSFHSTSVASAGASARVEQSTETARVCAARYCPNEASDSRIWARSSPSA